jgi:hypothetical protein
MEWVFLEKIHTTPMEEISAIRRGRQTFVPDNSKCTRTSERARVGGGGGLTYNFLCGGGSDVFWYDPMGGKLGQRKLNIPHPSNHSILSPLSQLKHFNTLTKFYNPILNRLNGWHINWKFITLSKYQLSSILHISMLLSALKDKTVIFFTTIINDKPYK